MLVDYRILILFLLILSMPTWANEFLKNSKVLKEEGIKAYSGEYHSGSGLYEIVIENNYKLSFNNLFQVENEGFIPLKGRVGVGKISGCGGKYNGISYPVSKKASPVIFEKKSSNLQIIWKQASALRDRANAQCFKKSHFLNEIDIKNFNINGVEIYIKRSKNKKSDREFRYLEVGTWSLENGTCKKSEFYKVLLDEDGKNPPEGSVTQVFGLLQFQKNDKIEKWMLFKAPGYEGEGILALPLSDLLQGKFSNLDWLIYNGC